MIGQDLRELSVNDVKTTSKDKIVFLAADSSLLTALTDHLMDMRADDEEGNYHDKQVTCISKPAIRGQNRSRTSPRSNWMLFATAVGPDPIRNHRTHPLAQS